MKFLSLAAFYLYRRVRANISSVSASELAVNFAKIMDGVANVSRSEFRKLKSDVPRTGRPPMSRTNIILDKDREPLIMEPPGGLFSIEPLPSRELTQHR
jgi:hypothetical protein